MKESFVIIALLTVAIIALIFIILKAKKKTDGTLVLNTSENSTSSNNNNLVINEELSLIVNEINEISDDERNQLIEITDSKIIERIDNLVPQVGHMVVNAQNVNVAQNIANQVAELNNKNLYEVIIPPNAKLCEAKNAIGGNRGFYRGQDGIQGHANLIKQGDVQVANVNKVANIASNAMAVGSMVVGQYYMETINQELSNLSSSLDEIKTDRENTFEGEIQEIIQDIYRITKYKDEIIHNEETRLRELKNLDEIERDAKKKLSKVNKDLTSNMNKKYTAEEYQYAVAKYNKSIKYQKALLLVIQKICELRYLFSLGNSSSEYCYQSFNDYYAQSQTALENLQAFHDSKIKELKIDVKNQRYRKNYFLENVLSVPISWINDDWNYKRISSKATKDIQKLSTKKSLSLPDSYDVYERNTKLIVDNGKYYYQIVNNQNTEE